MPYLYNNLCFCFGFVENVEFDCVFLALLVGLDKLRKHSDAFI